MKENVRDDRLNKDNMWTQKKVTVNYGAVQSYEVVQ